MAETEFGKDYYERIWGTVHRHDYCLNRAQMLVSRYGPGRFLDIGTGCGYTVKALRELGADAWGLEISDYAVKNTCAPGYVLKGSVTDIPFRDNRFDVVASQGLWSYIPKQDVPQAAAECHRVGKEQDHNIDYLGAGIDEEYFATAETQEWWGRALKPKKILLSCPVHICKEYAMQRWIDAVKQIRYPNLDILVVDNSPNFEMAAKYGDQVPMVGCAVPQELPLTRITRSMEVLRQAFLNGNYWKWFNLEVDVIPDPDILEILLKYDADWVGHAYPLRGETREHSSGIGCTVLSRRIVSEYNFGEAGEESPDCWLWEKVRGMGRFTTIEIWGHTKVRHLAE